MMPWHRQGLHTRPTVHVNAARTAGLLSAGGVHATAWGTAAALGVPTSAVAKTMALCIHGQQPCLAVTRGDQRVDMHKAGCARARGCGSSMGCCDSSCSSTSTSSSSCCMASMAPHSSGGSCSRRRRSPAVSHALQAGRCRHLQLRACLRRPVCAPVAVLAAGGLWACRA
jgi:hypothetical protein